MNSGLDLIFSSNVFFGLFSPVITLPEAFLYLTLIGQDSPEMADLFELREESGPSLCQEVTNLTSALQDYQLMVQVSSQRSAGTRLVVAQLSL